MTIKTMVLAAILGLAAPALALSPAVADPPHGYKVKVKHGKHGRYKHEDYRFDGGPPPWAPAHGYRRKHGRGGHQQAAYVPPIDLGLGHCDREVVGALLGGAAGAAIGSTVGDGDGRTAAIIGGAVIGTIVGGAIGHSMDQVDHNCVSQALEHAPDGVPILWDTDDNGSYEVTPTRTYQTGENQYCREYITTARIGGREQQVYGRACRQPDGSWELNS